MPLLLTYTITDSDYEPKKGNRDQRILAYRSGKSLPYMYFPGKIYKKVPSQTFIFTSLSLRIIDDIE